MHTFISTWQCNAEVPLIHTPILSIVLGYGCPKIHVLIVDVEVSNTAHQVTRRYSEAI